MDIAFTDPKKAAIYSRACGARGWNEAALLDHIPSSLHDLARAAYQEGKRWHKKPRCARLNPLLVDRLRKFFAGLRRVAK